MNEFAAGRNEKVLWIVGLGLLLFWVIAKTQTGIAQSAAIRELDAQIAAVARAQSEPLVMPDFDSVSQEAVNAEPNETAALAVLEMPGLGIEVAVFNGTSADVLNQGVGRIAGTAGIGQQGNLALAGHRDGFFRPLKDVQVGDSILVRHLGGIDRYEVSDLLIVEPEDVWVLNPTETTTLTLVTCYPFYYVGNAPQRFIVVADKTSNTVY